MAGDNKSEFDAFVRAQQKSGEDAEIDWNKERDTWLASLDTLYKKIEEFLSDYLQAGQILLRYSDIQLNEEDIGSYCARRLTIRIGGSEIVFEPIGTILIGVKGRVDVTGPAGSARIVLVDKDAVRFRIRGTALNNPNGVPLVESPDKLVDLTWKLVTPPPTVSYIELARDSLYRALMEVGGG